MGNKQTAVESLKNNLIINGSGATTTFPELFEQAKAMEKDQISNGYYQGLIDGMNNSPREYYEETYGK